MQFFFDGIKTDWSNILEKHDFPWIRTKSHLNYRLGNYLDNIVTYQVLG